MAGFPVTRTPLRYMLWLDAFAILVIAEGLQHVEYANVYPVLLSTVTFAE
jgi:hypothetical protein